MHRPTRSTARTRSTGTFLSTLLPLASLAAVLLLNGAAVQAQDEAPAAQGKLGSAPPVTYANRYELYGGFNFQNTMAGQDLPTRANLGGIEILGTDWLTPKWGVGVEFRGEAGSTPTLAAPIAQNNLPSRPNIYQLMFLGGAEYRGPKNQYAAWNVHAFGGAAHGVFDAQTAGSTVNLGLYTNRTSPQFALGTSVDINRSKKWAIRIAPDLIVEHWGTETREFFYLSGGVVYRIGKK